MIAAWVLFFGVAQADEMRFEAANLRIGNQTIHVQVADTDSRRSRGLMFVKSLPADEGMLFVFDDERELTFWMKNTLIPLSVGFFDRKGTLVDVQEMVPASLMEKEPTVYRSQAPASFALEMNSDWFSKHHLKNGSRIQLTGATGSALLKENLSLAGPLSRRVETSKKHAGE